MIKEEVDAINDSSVFANIAATGGGSKFIGDFLSFGGGSKTIYGFYVPYSQKATDTYLGFTPKKYVSPETAEALAIEAYRRCKYEDYSLNIIGVGVTCKLTTGEGERAGRENVVYIAYADFEQVTVFKFDIHKHFKDVPEKIMTRVEQELLVSELIHDLLFFLGTRSETTEAEYDFENKWNIEYSKNYMFHASYRNMDSVVEYWGQKQTLTKDLIIFPGSFNPLHDAHKELATLVMNHFPDNDFAFELSVRNFDKGNILPSDLNRRLCGLGDFSREVFVSNCVLLHDKAKAFHKLGHKVKFLIGFDTFVRWADATNPTELRAMRQLGVELIVIPRGGYSIKTSNMARFPDLSYELIGDLICPLSYDPNFINYHNPISSTQLRNEDKK
jgi:nicotinamide mononucleotide (NMN) deamidase PncC